MLNAIARSTEKILRRSYTHLNNNQKILLSTFAVHNTSKYKSKIEERISMLGHQLPSASTPAGSYISCVRSGNMIYTAGHLPFDVNGELITGNGTYFSKDIGNFKVIPPGSSISEIYKYSRAFYYPPHEPAYFIHRNKKIYVSPECFTSSFD